METKKFVRLEEFLESKPSREEIAERICSSANNYFLEVDETMEWEELSNLGGFKKEDFYDDVVETYRKHGKEALMCYGLLNWKLKDDVLQVGVMV